MNTLFEKVSGYPQEKLDEALEGAKVVVIPAGVPRKVIFLLFDLLCILIAFFFSLEYEGLFYVLLLSANLFVLKR